MLISIGHYTFSKNKRLKIQILTPKDSLGIYQKVTKIVTIHLIRLP